MTTHTGHTPGEWLIHHYKLDREWTVEVESESGFVTICRCSSKKDAEFICRAVNNHADFLEFLDFVDIAIQDCEDNIHKPQSIRITFELDYLKRIKSVRDKATGKESA